MESNRGHGCVTAIIGFALIVGGGIWSVAHYWY